MWLTKMWKLGILAVAEILFDALAESLETGSDHPGLADSKRTGETSLVPKALNRDGGFLILSDDSFVPLVYFYGDSEFSTNDFDGAIAATAGPDTAGDFHTIVMDQIPALALH